MKRKICAVLLIVLLLIQSAAALPAALIPGGNTVGIELLTDGLIVTGVEPDSPAANAGLREGDRIAEANGSPVETISALQALVQDGNAVVLNVLREGRQAAFLLTPAPTEDGHRLGLYLKDHIAGIGTVTYYDPLTGDFGALGHGVSDPVSGKLLDISGGVLVASAITEIERGRPGRPGLLRGSFTQETILGTVEKNREHGLFGTVTSLPNQKALPVAQPSEIRLGDAFILSNVEDDQVEAFKIRIDRVFPDAENGRNLLLTVTDEKLLDKTGGIVQGMSGSPIIQNGKLIGAVTHVLVNAPEMGYGTFLTTMLDAAA